MKSVLMLRILTTVMILPSCRAATFSGETVTQQPAARQPTPTSIPTITPPPTPPTGVPHECENSASTKGVFDSVSNKTFRLLTSQYSYDDGVNGCKGLNANGKMIYQSQELPDEILACRKVLGTLWMRASESSALSLWQPTAGGTEEAQVKHWIICYY
jgi:hypothetical protein